MLLLTLSAKYKILVYFFLFTMVIASEGQEVFINEFLASNSTTNTDPDFNEYSDWLEIYNLKKSSINLGGYYLTDNLSNATKWKIPADVTIEPFGFIVFWTDGKNDSLNGYHTNFKLTQSGEEIGLFDPSGNLVDSVSYTSQISDISNGRKPDGSADWFFFEQPTPGSANNSAPFLVAPAPDFSLSEGFYTEEQRLTLSTNNPDAVIRYTLNGDEPTESSSIYGSSLQISSRTGDPNLFSEIKTNADPHPWLPDWISPAAEVFKATVVRARVFLPGNQPSEIVTKTYFVDENIYHKYPTLPVISVVSDFKHLFDNFSGIYVPGIYHRTGDEGSGNYFQDWEKPAHIEFFEPGGTLGFAENIGLSIQGGTSPASPQKGLHVIARNEYGNNRIRYPIFRNSKSNAKNLTEFKRFIIRAWGSVINASLFGDAFAHRIVEETDLDIQAYRPAIVFINGEYWGLHELREANKNSWYYQYHYNIDRENPGFDLLEHRKSGNTFYARVDEGDAVHWSALNMYINTHDLSLSENYEYVKTQRDADNFIMYIGHCIYTGKWDWPNNNEASWRPRIADGKWRWTQYDMETSFGVAIALDQQYTFLGPQYNMVKHVAEGLNIPEFGMYGPHPLLVKLLKNNEFKTSFITWFEQHLDQEFSPEVNNAKLDEMVAEIAPYMDEYRQRWPFVTEMNNDWDYHIQLIRDYIDTRADYVRQHLYEQFGTDIRTGLIFVPQEYQLYQNYPNPFNSSTTILFSIPKTSTVTVKIHDVRGREIETLINQEYAPGDHKVVWKTKNQVSGVYFYRMQANNFEQIKKTILLK